MKRTLTLIFGGLLMLLVALISAFISMRLAIHGREVAVPNLANLSDADAALAAKKLGLNLSVENRFYSAAIAPNHILSQSPVAGARVRRGWQVRVTESLGGQKVSVPDMTGETERPASLILRRLQLELGTVAHLPAPAPAGIVLAQSPPPNSIGLDGPRVALLVSDDEAEPSSIAYVMPLINGLTVASASAHLSTAGLHIASALDPAATPPPPVDKGILPGLQSGSQPGTPNDLSANTLLPDPAIPATPTYPPPPPAPVSPNAIITSQSPAAGRRVSRADAIRVTVRTPFNEAQAPLN